MTFKSYNKQAGLGRVPINIASHSARPREPGTCYVGLLEKKEVTCTVIYNLPMREG